MSMDSDADFSPDEEEEAKDYESHEHQPRQTTKIDYPEFEAPWSEGSSRGDDVADQEDRASQKRRASAAAVEPILKRHKGLFNNNYLDLLNEDIAEAANQVALGAEENLPPSQIGLTFWSPFEKKLFFEALTKLGKDEICGIAGRIRTKSEIEVRQYLTLVQDAVERRQQDGDEGLEYSMEMADHPAAVEISQPCCHALEEAADALSFRQERHEEIVEQKRWGECWNITPELARRIEGDHGITKDPIFASQHGLGFTEALRIKNFLQLSERMFMNASCAENNWQFVSEEPPTIRATALQDFHSLLVSITKKVVLTTLFLAESRIRAKRKVAPSARGLVRRKDVEAAIASLGMKQTRNEFWTTCARRLRLEVWNDELGPQDESSDESDGQPMSYDEVEKILRQEYNAPGPTDANGQHYPAGTISGNVESSESEDDDDNTVPKESDSESSIDPDAAEYEVNEEAKEVLRYSAYDFPETHRTREALRHRIRNEREQEAYADAKDARASWEAELEMWRLLQRQPPEPLLKPAPIDRGRRGVKGVENIYDVGRQWRQRLTFQSEWEMLGKSEMSSKKP